MDFFLTNISTIIIDRRIKNIPSVLQGVLIDSFSKGIVWQPVKVPTSAGVI